MKCLVRLLGLYETFHSSSKHKCPWCLVKQLELGDFTKLLWPFRKIQDMIAIGKSLAGKSEGSRSAAASRNGGVKVLFITRSTMLTCNSIFH